MEEPIIEKSAAEEPVREGPVVQEAALAAIPPTRSTRGRTPALIAGAGVLLLIAAALSFVALQRRAEVRALDAGNAALAAARYPEAIAAYSTALAVGPGPVRQYTEAALLGRAQAYAATEDLPAARVDLNQVLEQSPEQVAALLLRGDVALRQNDASAAMADYERALQLAPEQAAPYVHRGLAHLHFRRDAQALADFNQALALDGTRADALAGRGLLAYLNGNVDAALLDARTALQSAPTAVLALALEGACLVEHGEPATGLDLLNQAVALATEPRLEALTLYLRAQSHAGQGASAAALADADQIIALVPNWSWGYLLRGDLHLARAEGPQARADYQQALELEPEAGTTLTGRAAGSLQDGAVAAARADLEQALTLTPDYVPALVLRARAVAADNPDAALADLSHALELAPHFSAAYAQRADLYFQLERWTEARADYDQALAAHPTDLNALRQRAQTAVALGDYAAAIPDLDAALTLAPKDVTLLTQRAQAYLALDNLDLALRDALRALDLKSGLPIPQMIKGLYQLKHENYFQAVVDLTAALKQDPELARAYAERARAHFELHDPDRSRSDANRALELDPGLAQAYLARALVYVYEKSWDQALKDAAQAVELAPKDKEVWATRGQINLEGGDAGTALQDFDTALELDAHWIEGQMLRAVALDALQRYDDAITTFQAALADATDVNDIELAESSIADLQRIPPDHNGYRTWHDSYHGFDLTYPARWRQYVDPGEKIPLLLLGPMDKDYRANVILSITRLDYPLTAAELAKIDRPYGLPDYNLLREYTLSIDNHLAFCRLFTWTTVDQHLREVPVFVMQVYTVSKDQAVIFMASSRAEDKEKYQPFFEAVVTSFRFTRQ